MGKSTHRSEYIYPSFVVLGSTVVKINTFVLFLSSRSISGGFSLVEYIPCLLMCMCTIVVLIYFYISFLMSPSVRPGQVLSKPCLIALMRLSVFGMNSAAWRYCASSGLVVWSIILFVAISDCCVSRGTYHIPVCLLPVTFIICCPFFSDISACIV